MDQDEGQLVFTSDCIVNLQQFGEMEDYPKLVTDIFNMLQSNTVDELLLKKLFEAETDYLFSEERINDLIECFLDKIGYYQKYKENIVAMSFQICEQYMFSDIVSVQLITKFMKMLTQSITKNTTQMLISYLQRMSQKIIYINEQEKIQVLVNLYSILLQINLQGNNEHIENLINITDKLLRHKVFRSLVKQLAKKCENTQNLNKKYFRMKYYNYFPKQRNLIDWKSYKKGIKNQLILKSIDKFIPN